MRIRTSHLSWQTGVAVDYKGPLDVFVKTIRTEGPLALYKGFFPQVTYIHVPQRYSLSL